MNLFRSLTGHVLIGSILKFTTKKNVIAPIKITATENTNSMLQTSICVIVIDYPGFTDYLNGITQKYKKIQFLYYNKKTKPNDLQNLINNIESDVILYVNKIPNGISIKNGAYFLNTEQLTRINWLNTLIYLSKHCVLFDYSYENVRILRQHNISSNYIPYQYNVNEILNLEKTDDICMIGDDGPKRENIWNHIRKKKLNVTNIKGFDLSRDLLLFKHKILLNVHYADAYNVFEEIRCTRCVFNKMIVITEESDNINEYMYRKHIIVVPYDQILDKAQDVLNNYDIYYKKLFNNFEVKYEKDNKLI